MPTDLGSSSPAYRHRDEDISDPGADQKRRARWRLLGAFVFSLIVAIAASQLMLQEPRPLAQDFIVLMPIAGDTPSRGSSYAGTPPPPNDPPESVSGATPLASERVEAPAVVTVTPESASAAANGEKGLPRGATSSAPGGSRAWFVQLGAYDSQEAAAAMAVKVRSIGYTAVVQSVTTAQGLRYRVRVGPFNEAQAKAYLERARSQGYAPFLIRP